MSLYVYNARILLLINLSGMDPYIVVTQSVRKHLRSYKAAFNGLRIAFLHELNFQIELIAMMSVVILGFIFKIERYEWIILIFCVGITFSAELMNTSIETLSELKKFYVVIKKIKDLAAAAVLAVAVMDLGLAIVVFGPRILNLMYKIECLF